ncbi:MAG: F0F1 ATP synthase subunit epsilon [Terrimicrobiaceae bacterium]
MPLNLEIVTPDGITFADTVTSVVVPSTEGELGLLPEHVGLVVQLEPGELRVDQNGQEIHLAVGGGFVEIAANKVAVLTDMAIREDDIDESAAEEAMQRAEKAMRERKLEGEEHAAVAASLQRSLAQLKVKRRRG